MNKNEILKQIEALKEAVSKQDTQPGVDWRDFLQMYYHDRRFLMEEIKTLESSYEDRITGVYDKAEIDDKIESLRQKIHDANCYTKQNQDDIDRLEERVDGNYQWIRDLLDKIDEFSERICQLETTKTELVAPEVETVKPFAKKPITRDLADLWTVILSKQFPWTREKFTDKGLENSVARMAKIFNRNKILSLQTLIEQVTFHQGHLRLHDKQNREFRVLEGIGAKSVKLLQKALEHMGIEYNRYNRG